jgi:hypothetical protein
MRAICVAQTSRLKNGKSKTLIPLTGPWFRKNVGGAGGAPPTGEAAGFRYLAAWETTAEAACSISGVMMSWPSEDAFAFKAFDSTGASLPSLINLIELSMYAALGMTSAWFLFLTRKQ